MPGKVVKIIFAGPSLPPPYPAQTSIEYRPPARRGDLLRAIADGAAVIGLIDGVFHQDLAVTPREVREAAHLGVRLFGGASIGALRACECPDSMTGVGSVWKAYARGDLTDDDEVAVTFDPATFALASYPFVQIRELLRLGIAHYPQCATQLELFAETVRRLPFHQRSLAVIQDAAAVTIRAGVPWEDLKRWLTSDRFDLKRADAHAVVMAVEKASCD
jgi:TfuA protein